MEAPEDCHHQHNTPAGCRVVLFTTFLSALLESSLHQNIILEQLPPGESFSAVLMSVSRFQIVRRNGNLTQKVFEEVIFREMFGVY